MKKTLSIRAGGETLAPARPSAERLARLKDHARDLRREPTEAELLLWEKLKDSRLGGLKFARKAVVGTAIVDFACAARWVVISITQPEDSAEIAALQDGKLAETGIRVLRFTAAEVTEELDRVVRDIVTTVNIPFERPRSSPSQRRHAG